MQLEAKMNSSCNKGLKPVNLTNHIHVPVQEKSEFCLNMKHIALPYPIDEENGSAKFDKSKRQLTVTLPVLPATDIPQMVGMVIYLFSSAIEC